MLVGSEDEDTPQVVASGSIVTGSLGSEDALQVAPKKKRRREEEEEEEEGEKEEADSSLFRGRGVAVEEPSLPVSGGREVNLT